MVPCRFIDKETFTESVQKGRILIFKHICMSVDVDMLVMNSSMVRVSVWSLMNHLCIITVSKTYFSVLMCMQ